MAILSMTEMPELKSLAQEYGYDVHIHDSCGGQAFGLEKISETASDEIFGALERFFEERKMTVVYFDARKTGFTVK